MLALRSVLRIDALDVEALRAATTSAADAILIDLAGATVVAARAEARSTARRYARLIAETGRPVLARVSSPRTGEMDADLDAMVDGSLPGVVLAGVEEPQDGRDADVQIRKHEMRRTGAPGAVTLIAEVDSAAGLLALPRVLPAIDRYSTILLDVDAFGADMGSRTQATESALAQIATIAAANSLQWIASVADGAAGVPHAHGAAGLVIRSEAEARGLNSLFAPEDALVERARRIVSGWARRGGASAFVVDGEVVDRRALRRATMLVELASAITRRETAGS